MPGTERSSSSLARQMELSRTASVEVLVHPQGTPCAS
jgi:hypothetical protein